MAETAKVTFAVSRASALQINVFYKWQGLFRQEEANQIGHNGICCWSRLCLCLVLSRDSIHGKILNNVVHTFCKQRIRLFWTICSTGFQAKVSLGILPRMI